MRLLIDTNAFPKVFDRNNRHHNHFEAIAHCLFNCKGQMVYGGTKLLEEYEPYFRKWAAVLLEMKRSGKLVSLNHNSVDVLAGKIKNIEPNSDFDDPHLIACIILGKCAIICTDDSRADRFIGDARFYPRSTLRPKIFRNRGHRKLLWQCW